MLEAKTQGVDFSSTLTLGRQKNNMTQRELAYLRKSYGIDPHPDSNKLLKYRSYADLFFLHYLCVKKLSVIDYSDYENADIIHDMNQPVPESLWESFDVVIDGGTLEHIFNFPTAIKNCMMMVNKGGSIFIFSMANNHCGHGFYQFSPELFFRVFEENNGFNIRSVVLVKHPFPGAELSQRQECYKVSDPKIIGRRSSLVSRSPLGIMVHAIKISAMPIFLNSPNQSDYTSRWANENGREISGGDNNKFRLFFKQVYSKLPLRIRLWLSGYRQLWKFNLRRDIDFYNPW
jgi:SAM-dependent methyltransferase|tara:strand:- start:424 stop:1290 length:867 start_codon:yes stop_codon:yes gene_type:complete